METQTRHLQAPWLLMLEGDYVWMKPLQAPKAESAAPSWAFPYSYIAPAHSSLESVMRIMYPAENGPLEHIPNSGPAPVLMRVEEWIKARSRHWLAHDSRSEHNVIGHCRS